MVSLQYKTIRDRLQILLLLLSESISLTNYSPVLLFYTPWKHQKTFRFSDVFRVYRKATPGCNGLNSSWNRQKTSRFLTKNCRNLEIISKDLKMPTDNASWLQLEKLIIIEILTWQLKFCFLKNSFSWN